MRGFTPLDRRNRMNGIRRHLTGFTLVEVLITVAIFSLIFMAIFAVLTIGESSWYSGDISVELNQEIGRALLTMTRQLRQSRSTVISNVPADDTYYNSITFKVPQDIDGDGDVINSSGNMEWSQNISYSLNENKQIIRSTASGSSILANNIFSLQFKRFSGNDDVIQIYIIARKVTARRRSLESSIISSVKMRN